MLARSLCVFGFASLLLSACSHNDSVSPKGDAVAPIDAKLDGPRPAPVSVLTQHNDSARSGANTAETCLTPAVAPTLKQRATLHVDGLIFAQPLLLASPRNLLIVATTANELAAFDVGTLSTTPVWKLGQETFGIPGTVEPGPGPVGILSTPVIDPATNRIYLIARSCASTTTVMNCPQTVHVIDAVAGKHLDSIVVSGGFTDGSGAAHTFDPDSQMNRPGLLLQAGKLVAAWGVMTVLPGQIHEGEVTYHGTIMAFDTTNLHAAPLVYVTTPNGFGAGIWQAGAGVAGDGTSIYFDTGNSTLGPSVKPSAATDFPATPRDQENSVVKLQLGGASVQVSSYFDDRPYHADGNVFQYMNYYDYDLASAGVALIPDSNALVTGSKGGIVYLIDKTTMKSMQTPLSPFDQQALPAGQTLHIAGDDEGPIVYGAAAVWRRSGSTNDALVYLWPRFEKLTSFRYLPTSSAMAVNATSTDVAGTNGAMLSLTANGSSQGSAVLWVTTSTTASGAAGPVGPGAIRAYDPDSLKMLWQANVQGYAKFCSPTVASGRVYVPSWSATGGSDVVVFGTPACGN